MKNNQSVKRQINFLLIHDGVQPGTLLDEPLRFGLQDVKGEVHPGLTKSGEPRNFDFVLEVSGNDEAEPPVFRGAFAHGPSKRRFVYLSWKRQDGHEHPYGWRIKVPLSGIGWDEVRAAEKSGKCLAANVVGRRPHTLEPIDWQIGALRNSCRPCENSVFRTA